MSKQILNTSYLTEEEFKKEIMWYKEEVKKNYPIKKEYSRDFHNNVNSLFKEIIETMKNNRFIGEEIRFVSYDSDDYYNNTVYVVYEIMGYAFITLVSSNVFDLDEYNSVLGLLHFIKSSFMDNYNIARLYHDKDYSYHRALNVIYEDHGDNLFDHIIANKQDTLEKYSDRLQMFDVNKPSFSVYLEQPDNVLIESLLSSRLYLNEINDADLILENYKESKVVNPYGLVATKRNVSPTYNYSQKSDYQLSNTSMYYSSKNIISPNYDKYLDIEGLDRINVTDIATNKINSSFNPFRLNLLSPSGYNKLGNIMVIYMLLSEFEIENSESYIEDLVSGLFTNFKSKVTINSKMTVTSTDLISNKSGQDKRLLYMDLLNQDDGSSSIVLFTLINNMIYNYINNNDFDWTTAKFGLLDVIKFNLKSHKLKDFRKEVKEIYKFRVKDVKSKAYKRDEEYKYKSFKESVMAYVEKLGLNKLVKDINDILGDEEFMNNEKELGITESQVEKFNRRYGMFNEIDEQDEKDIHEYFEELNKNEEKNDSSEDIDPKVVDFITSVNSASDLIADNKNDEYEVIKDSKIFQDITFKYAGQKHILTKVPNSKVKVEINKKKLFINCIFDDAEFNYFVNSIKFIDSRRVEFTSNEGKSKIVNDYYDILTGEESLNEIRPTNVRRGLDYNIDLIKNITGLSNISKEGNKVYHNGEFLCEVEELMI
ncbi:hypothetical protein [Staphylococcus phage vB_StaM_SA1]|nr:hypothetical protein [Staphylococcus phage vB_StaM_SA1]